MPRDKCDVVIRFDDGTGRIVVHAVASSRLDALLQNPHPAWVGDLEKLQTLAHDEAEGLVGRKVLRELDCHSPAGLGLRDFAALEREELQATLADLEQRAQTGDPSAQFEAFRALWNQALKTQSMELLARAERFLEAAVAQQHEQALAMAAAWPVLRAQAAASIGSASS